MEKKVKVLIVDDSKIVRDTLRSILTKDPVIEIIGEAEDPFVAASIIKKELPDVITLDIEMPKMNGLTFLRKIMSQFPIPTIIVSTLSAKGSEVTMKALKYGAVDFYTKSEIDLTGDLEDASFELISKVRTASDIKVRRITPKSVKPKAPSFDVDNLQFDQNKVVVIGSSTGGTEAILKVIRDLPANFPPVAIVQHMPPMFTKQFAQRLNDECNMNVVEGTQGTRLKRGQVVIAPGDYHMLLENSGMGLTVSLNQDEKVNRHRPSVDVLFDSVDKIGSNFVALILTGMGNDGAKGLLKLKERGVHTIAQDKESSVVYGMPKAAAELGAATEVLSIDKISERLVNILTV